MGFQDFAALDVLSASDVDEIMRQTTMRFASAAARDSALAGNLEAGMLAQTTDTQIYWRYNGSAWIGWLSPEYSFSVLTGSNVTIGNGTFVGSYQYAPDGIRIRWRLAFGTTSSFNGGNATWVLPISLANGSAVSCLGTAIWYDSSGNRNYPCVVQVPTGSSTATIYHAESGNAGIVNASAPFALNASGDIMIVDILVPH
jgi:hypothetical protein